MTGVPARLRVEWEERLPDDLPGDLAVPDEAIGTIAWLRSFDAAAMSGSLCGRVQVRYAVLRGERGICALMPVVRAEGTQRGYVYRVGSVCFDWLPHELRSSRGPRHAAARVVDLLVRGAGLMTEAPLVAVVPGSLTSSPPRHPGLGPEGLRILCTALLERARAEGRWLIFPGLRGDDAWTAAVGSCGVELATGWPSVHMELAPGPLRDDVIGDLRASISAEGGDLLWTDRWGRWAEEMSELYREFARREGHDDGALLGREILQGLLASGSSRCLLVHREDRLLAFALFVVRQPAAAIVGVAGRAGFVERSPEGADLWHLGFTVAPSYLAQEGVTDLSLGPDNVEAKTARGGRLEARSFGVVPGSRWSHLAATPALLARRAWTRA